ncbi:MAG: response regulator [candidate division Zixibacteria bacterium]|nr:response regulator [candidate division Zixibacteria bacterium]
MYKVLIIDDTDGTYAYCREFLSDQFQFYHLKNGLNLNEYLKHTEIHLILLDKNFQEIPESELVGPANDKINEGLHILAEIKKINKSIPVMMLTSYGDLTSAERAIRLGAYDYIESDMLSAGESLIRNRMLNAINRSAADKSAISDKFRKLGVVGSHPNTLRLFQEIEGAARSNQPVLLLGPTGSGKDLTALAIHRLSNRKNGVFVNCSLPERAETMMESELFGHRKGAFTGATQDRAGFFERADGGTLLLNEIGDFPLGLQTKLLRVIEEKTVFRIGGGNPVKTDFRLVCATNKDLQSEVSNGNFREDLLYRINKITIKLPSLSERIDDIPQLVYSILDNFSLKYGVKRPEISDKAIEALKNRQWAGNIRELKSVVEYLAEHCEGAITLGALASVDMNGKKEVKQISRGAENHYLNDKTISQLERELIEYNFKKYNGDIDKMTASTGISRSKIYERFKQYGLT